MLLPDLRERQFVVNLSKTAEGVFSAVTAIVEFPGRYIAEIHSLVSSVERPGAPARPLT
jgi:hypothetical protein